MNAPDSSTRDILIVFILIGAALCLVVFTYAYNVHRYGRTAARLIVPRRLGWLVSILLSVMFVSVLFTTASRQVMDVVMVLVLVLLGGVLLWSWLRQRRSVSVLLDLGIVPGFSEATMAILGVSAFLIFIFALSSSGNRDTLLFLGFFVLLLALSVALGHRNRTLLTADGIYYRQSLIRWARIKRVIWAEIEKDPVMLIVQVAGRLFPYDLEEIQVLANRQQAVQQILANQVKTTAFPSSASSHADVPDC